MAGEGYLPGSGGQRIGVLSLGQAQGQAHSRRASFGVDQTGAGRASVERQLWGEADAAGAGSTRGPSRNPTADPSHAGERVVT